MYPRQLRLGPILFNIFINDVDDGTEYTLSMFADETIRGGVADTRDGCVSVQRDLGRPEKWSDKNLSKFNKRECKVLNPGRNNSVQWYRQGANGWKAAWQRRTLGS